MLSICYVEGMYITQFLFSRGIQSSISSNDTMKNVQFSLNHLWFSRKENYIL